MTESEKTHDQLTRRGFLKTTAAVAGASVVGGAAGLTTLATSATAEPEGDELTLAGHSCCTFATCGNCMYEVWTRDGHVAKTEVWAENPAGEIPCLRGRGAVFQRTYGPRRLKYPMRRVKGTERGAGQWERISWEEAIEDIKTNVGGIMEKYGPKSVLWNGANGCMSVFGTANLDHYTRMQNILGWTKIANGWDDNVAFGRQLVVGDRIFMGPAAQKYESYESSIFIGANYGPCSPFSWDERIAMKNSGAKIVVIDPVFTHMANIADLWVNLRPGSDPALYMGLINQAFERGVADIDFLTRYTVAPVLVRKDNGRFLRKSDVEGTAPAPENNKRAGVPGYFLLDFKQKAIASPDAVMVWDATANAVGELNAVATPAIEGTYTVNGIECSTALTLLKKQVAEWTPSKVAETCEITEQVFEELTDAYFKERVEINYMYGANWYWNSTETGRGMATLEAVLGKIAPPSMSLDTAFNKEVFTANGKYPMRDTMSKAGLRTVLETGKYRGEDYPLKALFLAGCGSFVAGMDFNGMKRDVLPQLEYIVGIDIIENDTTDYCDLVLPAVSNYEKWDIGICATKSYDQCIDPLFEGKEDYEIGCMIGAALCKPEDADLFKLTKEEYAAQLLDTPTLKYFGVDLDTFREAHIMNTWTAAMVDSYDTPTGRLEFYTDYPLPKEDYGEPAFNMDEEHMVHWYPPVEAWPNTEAIKKHPFILISTRHFMGFHTQYFDTEWTIETEPGPTVRINPSDAAAYGITEGMLVECYNDRGHAVASAALSNAIRPGMLVYPKGWGARDHEAGMWGELTRPEYATMGQDVLLFDCCVSIRPWAEGKE